MQWSFNEQFFMRLATRWKQMRRKRWFPCCWKEQFYVPPTMLHIIIPTTHKKDRPHSRNVRPGGIHFSPSRILLFLPYHLETCIHFLFAVLLSASRIMRRCNQFNESSAEVSKGKQVLNCSDISFTMLIFPFKDGCRENWIKFFSS